MEVFLVFLILLGICTGQSLETPSTVTPESSDDSLKVNSGPTIEEITRLVMSDIEFVRQYEKMVKSLTGAVVLTCEPGWKYFEDHCYLFFRQPSTFAEAREKCQRLNSDLADINSFQENRFVKYEIRVIRRDESPELRYYYLGGTDENREGQWNWLKTGKQFGFTDWAAGEPNNGNGNEDCVILSGEPKSFWNDVPCQIEYYGVCKKSVEYKPLNRDVLL